MAEKHSFLLLWIFTHLIFTVHGDQHRIRDARTYKLVKSPTARMASLSGDVDLAASSVRECAIQCNRRPQGCFSFSYNEDDNTCVLGSWTVASGIVYPLDCHHHHYHDVTNNPSMATVDVYGKMYTSACCDNGFILRTNSTATKCVFYPDPAESRTFSDAKAECEDRDAQLMIFKTAAELNFVQWLLGCLPYTWVGIHDNCNIPGIDCGDKTSARKFFWVDETVVSGDVLQTLLKSKGVDNKGNEGCVHLAGNYNSNFNDDQCDSKFYYVCEKDPLRADIPCS